MTEAIKCGKVNIEVIYLIGLEFIRRISNKQIKDVAEAVGVSRQAVSSWEKQERPIPEKRLPMLLEYFGIKDLSYSDLQNDVDAHTQIYLQGLYSRTVIDAESHTDTEKIALSISALNQKIENVICSTPANIGFELEADYTSFQDRRISLINRFVDIIHANQHSVKLLNLVLAGIEQSNNKSHDEECDSLIVAVSTVINHWEQHSKRQREAVQKLLSEHEELF